MWKLSKYFLIDHIQASHDEAVKQRDALVNEAAGLKMELQQVRDDRDRLILQVQNLTDEVVQYKEYTENSCSELDSLTVKTNQLEVCLMHFSCISYACSDYQNFLAN